MTKQKIFDKVWNWFVVEGHGPSVMDNGPRCRYRGKDGAKCAVGVLIPDESYTPSMEGSALSSIAGSLGISEHCSFLYALQSAHDSAVCVQLTPFLSQVRINLEEVAKIYELLTPTTV